MADDSTGDTKPLLYFDDMVAGERQSIGFIDFTREEVLDFASRYDPQPFHLDDAAAAANPVFGRLSASGLHTLALVMKQAAQAWLEIGVVPLGGAGIDELRWIRPVFPGDRLEVFREILDLTPSRSKPDRGMMVMRLSATNQDGVEVISLVTKGMFPRRPPQ